MDIYLIIALHIYIYIGDFFIIQEREIPENQPLYYGMIEGFCGHCSSINGMITGRVYNWDSSLALYMLVYNLRAILWYIHDIISGMISEGFSAI